MRNKKEYSRKLESELIFRIIRIIRNFGKIIQCISYFIIGKRLCLVTGCISSSYILYIFKVLDHVLDGMEEQIRDILQLLIIDINEDEKRRISSSADTSNPRS